MSNTRHRSHQHHCVTCLPVTNDGTEVSARLKPRETGFGKLPKPMFLLLPELSPTWQTVLPQRTFCTDGNALHLCCLAWEPAATCGYFNEMKIE